MLPLARSRIAAFSAAWTPRVAARASYSTTVPRFSENSIQANDPNPPQPPKPNVSATNATPVDAMGSRDAPLREDVEAGERNRQLQAPNRARTWAASQQPREKAMTGPRFEQTIMEMQVCLGITIAIGCCAVAVVRTTSKTWNCATTTSERPIG